MSNKMISCFHIRYHTKATFPLKIPNKQQINSKAFHARKPEGLNILERAMRFELATHGLGSRIPLSRRKAEIP